MREKKTARLKAYNEMRCAHRRDVRAKFHGKRAKPFSSRLIFLPLEVSRKFAAAKSAAFLLALLPNANHFRRGRRANEILRRQCGRDFVRRKESFLQPVARV